MSVSGSFTTLDALGPDLPLADITGQVVAYSFFDGVQTLAAANSEIVVFYVATDGQCRISDWVITLWNTDDPHLIDGMDLQFSEGNTREDGFMGAVCTSPPPGPCTMTNYLTALHYGAVLDGPPGLWSDVGSCSGVVFVDGFESGDLLEWTSSSP